MQGDDRISRPGLCEEDSRRAELVSFAGSGGFGGSVSTLPPPSPRGPGALGSLLALMGRYSLFGCRSGAAGFFGAARADGGATHGARARGAEPGGQSHGEADALFGPSGTCADSQPRLSSFHPPTGRSAASPYPRDREGFGCQGAAQGTHRCNRGLGRATTVHC